MSATISLTGPSTTPGAPEVSPTAINTAVNAALATNAAAALQITGGTLTGALTGTSANFTGTLQAGATTIVTPSTGGTGLLTVGAGSANHITLSAPITSGTPAIAVTGSNGLSISGNGNTISLVSPISNGGLSYVFSGTTAQTWLTYAANLSGTTTASFDLNTISNTADTVDNSANSGNGLAALGISRRFGGTGTKGDRTGLRVGLNLNGGATSDAAGAGSAYIPIISFVDASANAGGTGLVGGLSQGSAVSFYPQAWLHPGATNFTTCEGAEWDIAIEGTKQSLTVGSGHVNGDIITATFTGSTITGSPLAVTYTVGTGNLAVHIVNGLSAAISNNAALIAAGVSAQQSQTTTSVLTASWPTQNTVSMAVATSGTGVLTLAGAISGASAKNRNGLTISRKNEDSTQGVQLDTAFRISDSAQSWRGGQWRIGFGIGDGVWPIAWNGTLIAATTQSVYSLGGKTGPFPPNVVQYGLDWRNVNFTQSAGLAVTLPGFSIDGTGSPLIGNARIASTGTGTSIDVKGGVATGNATVVAGGGGGAGVLTNNYFVGDLVFDDLGGQHFVSTVNNSTGAVTALTTVVQPSYTGSAPTTTRTTTGGSGSGLTVGLTWAATSVLSLNPSAGATTVGGSLTVNGTGTSLTVAHAMSVTGLATLSGGFTGNGVGGVLSGANAFLQVGNGGVRTYSGAASSAQASVLSQEILRGTVASGSQAVNYLWVSDDGAVGPTSNGQIATLQIQHTCTANAVGNRWGIDVNIANSAITAAGAVGLGGIRAQSLPAFNMGGTGTALGTSQGTNFGGNLTAFAQGTATNLRTVTGLEIDVGITAGASSYSKEGLKIVLLSTDAVQGAVIDYGLSIQSQVAQASGVGFKTGIVFGGNGGFGVAATGTLMGAQAGVGGMTAALGIDFSGITFSETPIKVPVLTNAANDAAAAGAGISVGGFYRNGSVVMQRVV